MSHADLLFELGTEELPPGALTKLSAALEGEVLQRLDQAGIRHGEATCYAAPRRLALWVRDVALTQPDRNEERRGPALQAAYDQDNKPTKALEGFARSCGVTPDQLQQQETEKGTWLVFRQEVAGQATATLLPEILQQAIHALPIPKRMRWGASEEAFLRPVHWMVLLLGEQVVPMTLFGIQTGQESRGHRFHAPKPIQITSAASYAETLEVQGKVVADLARRREMIREQITALGSSLGGTTAIDADLLDEVTALVEWPIALAGKFEARFLEVPQEALIASMQDHQKFFPVLNAEGRLLPVFITVSNLESRDPQKVIEGNERVIRPRLSDAAFFWEQDRKQPLDARRERLASVVYQTQLGSVLDKSDRVTALAAHIAKQLGSDVAHAQRAGELCKCDLLSAMVFEFPELQGLMGRYYAQADGEAEAVAIALEEQYMPQAAGDDLPASATGQALALAERLDTLVGLFGIGQPPTGDKDPFALRRAALGVLRIVIERRLPLDLAALIEQAQNGYPARMLNEDVREPVLDFMLSRLRAYYSEAGLPLNAFEAVLACRPTQPLDFDQRLRAVAAFAGRAEADSLAAANKRTSNLLKKVNEALPRVVDPAVLSAPAEQALLQATEALEDEVRAASAAADYPRALEALARLREPVDRFFDEVMVMSDDATERGNRLALLQRLRQLFLHVADVSLL
jgi:glycyl-tRNA synthetase beta chain